MGLRLLGTGLTSFPSFAQYLLLSDFKFCVYVRCCWRYVALYDGSLQAAKENLEESKEKDRESEALLT